MVVGVGVANQLLLRSLVGDRSFIYLTCFCTKIMSCVKFCSESNLISKSLPSFYLFKLFINNSNLRLLSNLVVPQTALPAGSKLFCELTKGSVVKTFFIVSSSAVCFILEEYSEQRLPLSYVFAEHEGTTESGVRRSRELQMHTCQRCQIANHITHLLL